MSSVKALAMQDGQATGRAQLITYIHICSFGKKNNLFSNSLRFLWRTSVSLFASVFIPWYGLSQMTWKKKKCERQSTQKVAEILKVHNKLWMKEKTIKYLWGLVSFVTEHFRIFVPLKDTFANSNNALHRLVQTILHFLYRRLHHNIWDTQHNVCGEEGSTGVFGCLWTK